jgi:hypothetical protein
VDELSSRGGKYAKAVAGKGASRDRGSEAPPTNLSVEETEWPLY